MDTVLTLHALMPTLPHGGMQTAATLQVLIMSSLHERTYTALALKVLVTPEELIAHIVIKLTVN